MQTRTRQTALFAVFALGLAVVLAGTIIAQSSVTNGGSVNVRTSDLDARSIWLWRTPQLASDHLAIYPDGTILAETANGITFYDVNPDTGAASLVPFAPGSWWVGVQPNPIIWADGNVGHLLGYWSRSVMYNQDGTEGWLSDAPGGCCNVLGIPNHALHLSSRRLIEGWDFAISIDLDTGHQSGTTGANGHAAGPVTIDGDVAYIAGYGTRVAKWDISLAVPTLMWTRDVTSQNLSWTQTNFSEGAVAQDGSFVVTTAGNHSGEYKIWDWKWRAGDLICVSPSGETSWSVSARATTPPVTSGTGLIFIGGLPVDGAPQDMLDAPGVVHAYNLSGEQVWSAPTMGLPQDLLLGDDGNVYVLEGGADEGRILVLDQQTGEPRLTIGHVPAPWEMVLTDGVIITTGASGLTAIPLPDGFAYDYDPSAPWPIRQHDNQRTAGRGSDTSSPHVTCASPDGLWHADNVGLTCTASDAGSGLADAADASFVLSTSVAAGTETANAATDSRTVCDQAGNCTTVGPVAGNRIDRRPPTITIAAPAAGTFVLGQAVTSNYACADGGSGVAGCGGPLANGSSIDTNTVGSHTFSVTATDAVGNTSSASVGYSVTYASGGACLASPGHAILQPVNTDGTSVFKMGSTVPAKFRVCDANGNSIGTAGVVASFRLIQTVAGTVTDVDESVYSTTPDAAFRWSATDQLWVFNIGTKSLTAQTTYVYRITLLDGSMIDFRFGLK